MCLQPMEAKTFAVVDCSDRNPIVPCRTAEIAASLRKVYAFMPIEAEVAKKARPALTAFRSAIVSGSFWLAKYLPASEPAI